MKSIDEGFFLSEFGVKRDMLSKIPIKRLIPKAARFTENLSKEARRHKLDFLPFILIWKEREKEKQNHADGQDEDGW